MNANELADLLHTEDVQFSQQSVNGWAEEAITMLRQQQSEIEALKEELDKQGKIIPFTESEIKYSKPQFPDKPVGWWDGNPKNVIGISKTKECEDWFPLYTHPVKEHDLLPPALWANPKTEIHGIVDVRTYPLEGFIPLCVKQDADTMLRQQQESIEGLTRDYDLLLDEHQLLLKKEWVGLTDEEIEKGRDQTFSINNPYCPCDSKTMRKAVRWAEAKLKDNNT